MRPRSKILRGVAWQLLPVLLMVGGGVIATVPLALPGLAPVKPALALIIFYHLSLWRPEPLPLWLVFLLGLLADALAVGPFGLNVLVFVFFHGLIASQRRFFMMVEGIVGFSWVVAAEALVHFVLALAGTFGMVDPTSAIVRAFLTLLLFPMVSLGLAQIDKRLSQSG